MKKVVQGVQARRKRTFLHRLMAITILVSLVIAAVFLFKGNHSGGVNNVTTVDVVEDKTSNVTARTTTDKAVDKTSSMATEVTDTLVVMHDTIITEDLEYPFNQVPEDMMPGNMIPEDMMPRDMMPEETLKGWWRYTIPGGFKKAGGYLPDIVQAYTYSLCKQNNIRYPLVLAIIEVESGYRYDAASDTNDIGYMQVNYNWQQDNMPDMTEKVLYNPYVNIGVGIRYLVELSEEFSTERAVLTAYHYGVSGAYSRCYKDSQITSHYADKVLEAADRIEEELLKREAEVRVARMTRR